ncbi:putative sugar O-methyltransferase [Nodosilinea nodulosa]|uniref:putative sugar O-methyltransferase n=1 Tax=Nodosilinea nodulosa TaxID=416001 RepID=UPI0002D84616|nr:putative sugar O-methyltransferase [Nodosilinea nodulosa]
MINKVLLSDLRNISQQEFEVAIEICSKLKQIVDLRHKWVQDHNLDPEIVYPSANWGSEGKPDADNEYRFRDLFELIANQPKYELINNLRLYSQMFSGYQLASFSHAFDKPLINSIESIDEALNSQMPESDSWVFRYLEMTKDLPKDLAVQVPRMLGEVGWDFDGQLINHDICVYQERVNLLYESGVIDRLQETVRENGYVNILEIGSGYGGLAYLIKNIIPEANYYCCDLPESLLFACLYLGLTCQNISQTIYDGSNSSTLAEMDSGFKFVSNHLFDSLLTEGIRIDLAINTLSMSEMSEKQIRYYSESLGKLLGNTGVFFEQNQDNRESGLLYCKDYITDYFNIRHVLLSKTIPGLTQGVADLWSNHELDPDHLLKSLKDAESTIAEQQLSIVALQRGITSIQAELDAANTNNNINNINNINPNNNTDDNASKLWKLLRGFWVKLKKL